MADADRRLDAIHLAGSFGLGSDEGIADIVQSIDPGPSRTIQWLSPPIGRISLKHEVLGEGEEPLYRADVVGLLDRNSDKFLARRFYFLSNGSLIGVIKNEIDPTEGVGAETEAAMKWQVDNGLTTPIVEDGQELKRILVEGRLDLPESGA